jgi:hypothetical protein
LATVTVNPYRLTIQAQIQKNTSLNTLVTSCGVDINEVIANGTTAGAVDLVYSKRLTIANSGTPTDIDLAGALTDPLGDAAVFAEVHLLFVRNNSTANNLSIGGDAAAVSTIFGNANDLVVLRPGALFCIKAGSDDATGYAITGTTADVLQFAISAGTNETCDVIIAGRSA